MGLGPSKELLFIREHYPAFITARDAIRAARDRGDDTDIRAATEAFFAFPFERQHVFSEKWFESGYVAPGGHRTYEDYRYETAMASQAFVKETIKEFIDVPWFCAVAIAWGYYGNIYGWIPGGLLGPEFDHVVALAEEAWPRVEPETPLVYGHIATDCTVYREPPDPQERHHNVAVARRLILSFTAPHLCGSV